MPSYLKNVTTLAVDKDKCTGCKMCTIVCPHEVLVVEDRKVHIVHRDKCMECSACAVNCATEAIKVRRGVGCAAAIISSALGRNTDHCC